LPPAADETSRLRPRASPHSTIPSAAGPPSAAHPSKGRFMTDTPFLINADQEADFLADWAVHSRFGAVEGTNGVDRQAASQADGQQRRWFAELLTEHGFRVERDAIGNQFGLLELVPGAPYVLTGSHLDSQPTAGRFDGAYGVMAA